MGDDFIYSPKLTMDITHFNTQNYLNYTLKWYAYEDE